MRTEKSLEEVRDWKNRVYECDKDRPTELHIDSIRSETESLKKTLNLRKYNRGRNLIAR